MDSTIAPRDWRKAKPGTHTKEVTKEALPREVQELLLEMADKINGLNLKQIDTERRLADAEALLHEIGGLRFKDGAFNEKFARTA